MTELELKPDQKSTELIKRHEIDNTPFQIIETEEKCFGAMGKFRITEFFKTKEEVEKELTPMTWDRIIQVTILLIEEFKNQKQ